MTARTALVAAVLLLLSGPAFADLQGRIYDLANPQAPRTEWQRKPLANAYVVISWSISIPAPGHATSSCRHVEIARSNDKGEYRLEGTMFGRGTLMVAYAPGLARVDWPWAERPEALKEISMAKSTQPADERLMHLALFGGSGCSGVEIHDPQGVLKAYYAALAAEARALTPTSRSGTESLRMLEAKAKPAAAATTPMRIEAAPVDGSLMQGDTPRAAKPSSR